MTTLGGLIDRPGALRPVLVASHPRSGTHVVIDTIRRQFTTTRSWRWWGLPLDHLYLNVERLGADQRRFSAALARKVVNRPRRALLKTHFLADWSDTWEPGESAAPPKAWHPLLAESLVVYVTRHPLNVLSSYLQFLASIDTGIAGMPLRSFLESPHWTGKTDRLGWWQQHVQGWLARPGVLTVRYEDLVADPSTVLQSFSEFLQERPIGKSPLLPPKVTSIMQTRVDRVFRLSPSSTAIVADRKRFPQPRWQETLTVDDLRWVAGRCGELLDRLGYSLQR